MTRGALSGLGQGASSLGRGLGCLCRRPLQRTQHLGKARVVRELPKCSSFCSRSDPERIRFEMRGGRSCTSERLSSR